MSEMLYEIPGTWRGRLAIASRPRGGDWLDDDIRALRSAAVDVLISSLMPDEQAELGLGDEEEISRRHGIEYASFPIRDRGVPQSIPAAGNFLEQVEAELTNGKTVAVHCRSGIGRSSLLAAALMAISGVDVDAAFREIEKARGLSVPDTPEQQAWVTMFARTVADRPARAAT